MADDALRALDQDLAKNIDALVQRLFGGAAEKQGAYWALDDIRGGAPKNGGSLKIWRAGKKQGEWYDFAAGKGGSPIGLCIRAPRGGAGNAREGIAFARSFLGLGDETPTEKAKREARAAAERRRREADDAAESERKRKAALRRWLEGVPLAGTLGEDYLARRAIPLAALARPPRALRFHPSMIFPDDGRARPCILGAVAGERGFLTVHRHWIERRADGDAWKADVVEPKRSYSSCHGGLIAIARGDSGKRYRELPDGEWIYASEGIEDALSIALAAPEARVVAAVALSHLGAMFVPPQAAGIVWHRHRGDPDEAVRQYERQAEALARRGIALREVWAPDGCKDFNAWLMAEAGLERPA